MSSNNVIIAVLQEVELVTSDSQAKATEANSPFLLHSRPGVTVDTEMVKPSCVFLLDVVRKDVQPVKLRQGSIMSRRQPAN